MSSTKKYEIVPKETDHGKWYQSVLTVSDMIDYTDVSGCYVLKPWANKIWELIKEDLDFKIRVLGTENCYFPLFVTKSNLEKESEHFDDFTPEVAWIQTTDSIADSVRAKDPEVNQLIDRLKAKGLEVDLRSGKSERYAVRPTSETIIYPHFADWMKKSGKYPKINQWANVVRWENKATQPFIRSREFLWQEGHTCHPDKESAVDEIHTVLQMYREFYRDILAVPMIPGIKTKSETFPGASITCTIEGFLPDSGKGIQSATSHYLGQKFSEMFGIKNSDGNLVHQNSWGLTTRSIGIMVMTHSDDRGLSLPPHVAPVQVVIVACGLNSKTSEEKKAEISDVLNDLEMKLNNHGIRTVYDSDPGESPGMKFNKWETKGVPLRIEFGSRDLKNDTVLFVRRDAPPKTKQKLTFSHIVDNPRLVSDFLENQQAEMYQKACDKVSENLSVCSTDQELLGALKEQKLGLIEWRVGSNDEGKTEQRLKELCKENGINSTKVLCIPDPEHLKEFGIEPKESVTYALYGRSY